MKDVTMRKKNLLLLSAAGFMAALGLVAFGPAASSQTPGPFTQAQAEAGRQAFAANCAACHQADLSGTNDAPQLAGFGLGLGERTRRLA
jgi:mono/diheme cytochrome c family protein